MNKGKTQAATKKDLDYEDRFHEVHNNALCEDYYITRKYWHLYIQHVYATYDRVNAGPRIVQPEFAKYSLLAVDSCSFDRVTSPEIVDRSCM